MEAMTTKRNQLRAQQLIQALKQRNMDGQLRRHQRGSPGTGSGLGPGRQLHRLGRLGEHRRHRPEGRGAAG